MAQISLDDRAFLAAFREATRDMDATGEEIVLETGRLVAERAQELAPKIKHLDPRFPPGELAISIGVRAGRDARGPWVDVGTQVRWALFVEYGTYKDRAQPFLRPALGLASKALSGSGLKARKQSPRARAFSVRAAKRALIRRALHRGQISGAQARGLSRQVSSTFRFRAKRRRRA